MGCDTTRCSWACLDAEIWGVAYHGVWTMKVDPLGHTGAGFDFDELQFHSYERKGTKWRMCLGFEGIEEERTSNHVVYYYTNGTFVPVSVLCVHLL